MMNRVPILALPAPPSEGNLGPLPLSQLPKQEDDEEQKKSELVPASVATHTRTIGIIYPPQHTRNIVNTTSQFVARNGAEFEKRIMETNTSNANFSFLNPSDPYHAYYQQQLSEFRAQNDSFAQQPPSKPSDSAAVPPTDCNDATAQKPNPLAQFKLMRRVLEPPEAEKYTVRLPEGITGLELDVIKPTAQFVARNGKSFLKELTSKEINNPQFHFLKPTHSMFMFFTSLADAYSKVLMPPKGLTEKLKKSIADRTTVLDRCMHRLEWERLKDRARQTAEDEIEQERVQMAMIDWHDFVVVETIHFANDEDEELPPPMTLEEVIIRSKVLTMDQVTVELSKEVDMEMDEDEIQLVEEGMNAARLNEEKNNGMKFSDDLESPMRIMTNWKRPEERIAAKRDPTKFTVSPITGELIPINEMSEHMRISLIDPKYKERRDRMFAKIRETTLAQDDEISRNIVGLARTRPDIFGTTEEEVFNAVKAEIENKKDKRPKQVIWDGHMGRSIGRTGNPAVSQDIIGEDSNGGLNNALAGPAASPPKHGFPSIGPLPPPELAFNLPPIASNPTQYPIPVSQPRLQVAQMMPPVQPPLLPMSMNGQQSFMVNWPPSMPSTMAAQNIPILPPPGSQFKHLPIPPQPFAYFPGLPPAMSMMPSLPMPHEMPPPPPEEALLPLPEEPELKRQKHDDSLLVPEDQFLAQHPGPVIITISAPNVDEGNLKGKILEITVQSLSETVGNLKEKIAGEIQLPSNKQKLSGKPGFLKDSMSLAYYNIAAGETLSLAVRERGGRKR